MSKLLNSQENFKKQVKTISLNEESEKLSLNKKNVPLSCIVIRILVSARRDSVTAADAIKTEN